MSDPIWENVGNGDFRRTKVPGGWLYEHWRYKHEINEWQAYAVVFVAATEQEKNDE